VSDDEEEVGEAESVGIVLGDEEARVVGALAEKSLATPESYPLSLNGLVTACNQSTNREPVVSYSEATVETALEGLREKKLARRIKAPGQRVVKHRHVLDETLGLDRPDLAIITLLLLRGPQTPGELKTRSGRLYPFASLDDVEAALNRLAAADRALVVHLARRPGQKESRWAERLSARDHASEPYRASAYAEPRTASSSTSSSTARARGPLGARRVRSSAAPARSACRPSPARSARSPPHPQRRGRSQFAIRQPAR